MEIRRYLEADTLEILALFRSAVHEINIRDYSPTQVNTWAPEQMDEEKWRKKLTESYCFVVIESEHIVGFANFEASGHIDCLYVHPKWRGPRVPLLLFRSIEEKARELGIKKLFSEISITARRAAEHVGFQVEREQQVKIGEVAFTNYVMFKDLE